MKKILATLVSSLLLASLVLTGCGNSSTGNTGDSKTNNTNVSSTVSADDSGATVVNEEPVTIMLAAAASLEDSFVNKLIPMFKEQYDWITVEGTYDSSGKLQTQIEEGLAADVFMSAATTQMNALVGESLVDKDSVVDLLENEIVLITRTDSDIDIASFKDITKAETIAIGDPESVPAGQYAEEALTSLGIYDEVKGKASFGTNVTEVLNWVAAGSAEVGIVYATDAAQMPDEVKVLAVAPEGSLAKPVIYPVGIVSATEHRAAADLFVEFLQSPEAIAVFVENGFKSNI